MQMGALPPRTRAPLLKVAISIAGLEHPRSQSAVAVSRGILEKSRHGLPSHAGAPVPLEVGGLWVVPSSC